MTTTLTLRTYPSSTTGEVRATKPKRVTGSITAWLMVFVIFAAALAITGTVLADLATAPSGTGLAAFGQWAAPQLGVLLAAGLPFLLTCALVLKVRRNRTECTYALIPCEFKEADVVHANQVTWAYERARYDASSSRTQLHALVFGLTASCVLLACATVAALGLRPEAPTVLSGLTVRSGLLSVATAVATVFSVQFARCQQRVASRDDTATMFSWATRALLYVIIADLGLFAVLRMASDTAETPGLIGASMLGVFVGVLGRDALRNMQARVAQTLQMTYTPHTREDTLARIQGLAPEDIERLAEEGIYSLTDLAFAPTARLFFNTGYSLQRIVDLQDQALLQVHVGASKAQALGENVGIRGATDLWELSERLGVDDYFPDSHRTAASTPAAAAGSDLLIDPHAALRTALSLSEGATAILLWRIHQDDRAKRLLVYARSAVSALYSPDADLADAATGSA